MSDIEIRLPKLGESITHATVVQWLKEVGESVTMDEPLLEVTTDKLNSEIPSPVSGTLVEKYAAVDQELEVGELIARISSNKPHEATQTFPQKNTVLSPAVLRLAQSEGLTIKQLETIEGTGSCGRISKKDVEHYLANKKSSSSHAKEDHIPMSTMRLAIAENMVRSFYQAPHASLVTEVDMTEIMKLIQQNKESFLKTHGVKLSVTSFVMQAMTKALKQYPLLNASLQDDTIILKHYINIGIAVNLDQGLVVPVVHNCDTLDIVGLALHLHEVALKARERKLTLQEMSEGTITLTNFGMTGTLIGVPIIRYPEVAIIGVGAVQKRVVVQEDDSFAVRQMMYVTLTFDHRVIDGIYGCQFLKSLKENLEIYFE